MTSTIGVKKIQHTNGTQVMTFDTAGKISSDVSSTGNITTTGTVNTASINGGQIGGRRNIIINGAFQHWQRGTSFSSNVFGADRWKFYAPGSHAYTRSTDTPDSPNNFQFSASAGGSGDATGLTQFVESANAQPLPSSGSDKVILSFYLKHTTNSGTAKITSSVGTMDSADNSGATTTRSTQNHNTTTGWARYTHEMTGADLTTAVTNGLVVTIKHNGSGATLFLITGIQLEISSQVTPFENRSVGEELSLCQRYFHKQGGTAYYNIAVCVNYTSGAMLGTVRHPVQMRAAPSVTKSGTWAVLGGDTTVNQTAVSSDSGPQASEIGFSGGSGGTSGRSCVLRFSNDANAYLWWDAEL